MNLNCTVTKKGNTIKAAANGLEIVASLGNRKMKDTLIFNVPARITCIGATATCAGEKGCCYAGKAERMYPQVLPCRMNNLNVSKTAEFAFLLRSLVIVAHEKYNINWVRIHESGDFYNQAYLNVWAEVIRSVPQVRFLAFTKSYQLDFSGLLGLENATLRYSVMPDTTQYSSQLGLYAYLEGSILLKPGELVTVCPGSDCHKCRYCWMKSGDVMFHKH